MELINLILRNIFRHKLRTSLTILGVAVAMLAFGILRTLVGAWYLGVDASSAYRLVTRNNISLIYMLPVAYRNQILQVAGVTGIGYGIWYGGIYKDKKNFFAQFAISGTDYMDLYPEFLLPESARKDFQLERNAAIAGKKLVERFGWKIGEVIPLEGTIFPGKIELVLKGIYKGATRSVDETALFFRWDYLNEMLKKTVPAMADKVGWYMVQIKEADRAAEISQEIDALFRNSLAETLTETEKAFQLGFVAMTGAIVAAIKVISIVVIGIILIVQANTMAMTARERSAEYAVLKTLGFGPSFLFVLIAGESLGIALMGGVLGTALTYPGSIIFQRQLQSFLPVFEITGSTVGLILAVSLFVGFAAALPPLIRVSRMGIAEGLGHMG
ncbi:MAG TPA: FtsX-like permease family protein [Desulfomonilaceae bacterium]|nr:FtsX-like permease family protein [Desulfomonilaceae bacterium]